MIRVSGVGRGSASAGARKAAPAGGGFRVESGPAGVASTAPAQPAAPVETLGALIALQSDAANGGRARLIAAAQRTLDLLDGLRLGLADGVLSRADLEALALAASPSADAGDVEPALASLHQEVVLRARVELAKLGR